MNVVTGISYAPRREKTMEKQKYTSHILALSPDGSEKLAL
jgi:hypothetical protein